MGSGPYQRSSAGSLAGQARAYESLREFFASATVGALVDLPFIFFFVGIVYLLGGVTALPLVGAIFLALLVALLGQIPMNRSVNAGYLASNQRYAMMVESVNALETVKATGSESELQSRMEDCVRTSAKADGQTLALGDKKLTFYFPTVKEPPTVKVQGNTAVVGKQQITIKDGNLVLNVKS